MSNKVINADYTYYEDLFLMKSKYNNI